MERDFTLEMYTRLCRAAAEGGYSFRTLAAYLQAGQPVERIVILRHDVDRWPRRALRIADLEAKLGLHATYYFRCVPGVFKPAIIGQVADLGHEIGYHYETLAKTNGDKAKALDLFGQELAMFRQVTQVSTICMHGSPLSRYDNRTLWETADFHQFGLLGEAYLSLDYDRLAYFTDTGRSWCGGDANLRDRPAHQAAGQVLCTTPELAAALQQGRFEGLCISAHPERWTAGIFEWTAQAVLDGAINVTKRGLRRLRLAGGARHGV